MTALWIAILGVLTISLAYDVYAKSIDQDIIPSDTKRATPTRMCMDGIDLIANSRNVLVGYRFRAIAAAGPIEETEVGGVPVLQRLCDALLPAEQATTDVGKEVARG